ncbi:MAG: hypothetical protein VX589_06335 [Myxococcota bacterium]|nr:hypothetical protein [Myxococcota bacterium]
MNTRLLTVRQFTLSLLACMWSMGTVGCASGGDGENMAATTSPLGVSTQSLVVGQTLELYVKGLNSVSNNDFQLMFVGRFFGDDGSIEDIRVSQPAILDGTKTENGETYDVIRLSRFGPFGNPFSEADQPGRFEGTVAVQQVNDDGVLTVVRQAQSIELAVEPSIIIDEFQPIEADCGAPALRALPGLAYRLAVRATGIKPVKFTYQFSRINGSAGIVEFVHLFEEPVSTDRLGDGCETDAEGNCIAKIGESVIFNQIDDNEQFYAVAIRIIAEDESGRRVETALPMTVHRPIEVRVKSQQAEVAERYPPVPVSGCMVGGIERRVGYWESKAESRQRSVSMTVSRRFNASNQMSQTDNWHEGITEGESQSARVGESTKEQETSDAAYGVSYNESESNQIGYSTNDGETWSWSEREGETDTEYEDQVNKLYGSGSSSTKVGVSGEGSVPGFAKASGSTSSTVGVTVGGSTGMTDGVSRTRNHSRGHSTSSSESEGRAFGSTVNEDVSREVGGSYALSNSRGRSLSESMARDRSRTWSFSGSSSTSSLVSEGMSESEQSTWSSTDSTRVVTQFFGYIPMAKSGMFFRQTTRLVKRAEVRSYNKCGLAEQIGELQFSEWEWAPALGLADSCDAGESGLLPVDLPKAECRIEPCDVR